MSVSLKLLTSVILLAAVTGACAPSMPPVRERIPEAASLRVNQDSVTLTSAPNSSWVMSDDADKRLETIELTVGKIVKFETFNLSRTCTLRSITPPTAAFRIVDESVCCYPSIPSKHAYNVDLRGYDLNAHGAAN